MKTWKLTVNEEELRALIVMHSAKLAGNFNNDHGAYNVETSQRIHDLTKRLNRETPEVEGDPRPKEEMPTPEPQTSAWS